MVLLVPARPTPKDENNGAGAPRTEVGDARLPGFCLAGHATRYDLQVLLVSLDDGVLQVWLELQCLRILFVFVLV